MTTLGPQRHERCMTPRWSVPGRRCALCPGNLAQGVHIGWTRIASRGGDSEPDGVITSFAAPHFRVTLDNGKVKSFRGHVLAPLICWRDKDFYDLSIWWSDYRIIQPFRIPGWSRHTGSSSC